MWLVPIEIVHDCQPSASGSAASAPLLHLRTSTSTSRSFGMNCSASSFCLRGIGCLMWVASPLDSLSRSSGVRRGQVTGEPVPKPEKLESAPVSLATCPSSRRSGSRTTWSRSPVQIKGKLRGRVVLPADADAAAMKAAAAADPKIAELIAGKEIAKIVAVPGRLVNFVLRG